MSRTLVWLPAILLLGTGCERGANSVPLVTSSSVVVRGNGGEPGSPDPALAEDVHAINILTDTFEGLIGTSADGEHLPSVAGEN